MSAVLLATNIGSLLAFNVILSISFFRLIFIQFPFLFLSEKNTSLDWCKKLLRNRSAILRLASILLPLLWLMFFFLAGASRLLRENVKNSQFRNEV